MFPYYDRVTFIALFLPFLGWEPTLIYSWLIPLIGYEITDLSSKLSKWQSAKVITKSKLGNYIETQYSELVYLRKLRFNFHADQKLFVTMFCFHKQYICLVLTNRDNSHLIFVNNHITHISANPKIWQSRWFWIRAPHFSLTEALPDLNWLSLPTRTEMQCCF